MILSAVIPCHNEEDVVVETNKVLLNLFNSIVSHNTISDYELLYVDDGSTDRTFEIIHSIAIQNNRVKLISFSNNYGHQAALTAGINEASGDVIVTLDADLQDPPEYIEKMLERINAGFDIVYGVRENRTTDSYFKRNTAQQYYKILNVLGVKVVYNHAEYRMFTKKVKNSFEKFNETNRFIRGIFPLMGYKYCTIEYPRDLRKAGETKYTLYKMISFAIEGVTSFSYAPLRCAAIVGFVVFICTLLLSAWALVTKLLGETVPGWASLVIPVYMLGGIQMVFIGICGEYIGKIYIETKKRPLYIVNKRVNL